jgi:hypothetical protein
VVLESRCYIKNRLRLPLYLLQLKQSKKPVWIVCSRVQIIGSEGVWRLITRRQFESTVASHHRTNLAGAHCTWCSQPNPPSVVIDLVFKFRWARLNNIIVADLYFHVWSLGESTRKVQLYLTPKLIYHLRILGGLNRTGWYVQLDMMSTCFWDENQICALPRFQTYVILIFLDV